jgi:hypothetical protein
MQNLNRRRVVEEEALALKGELAAEPERCIGDSPAKKRGGEEKNDQRESSGLTSSPGL